MPRPGALQGYGYGVTPRPRGPGQPEEAPGRFASRLQPDLVKAVRQDTEAEVRAAAGRALAWVATDVEAVVPALEPLREGDAGERRALARALADLIDRLTGAMPELGLDLAMGEGHAPQQQDALPLVRLVGRQLKDREAEVLSRSLQSLQRLTRAWLLALPILEATPRLRAEGLQAQERADLQAAEQERKQALDRALEGGRSFDALTGPVIGLLGHKDVNVAVAAHRALEVFAEARVKLAPLDRAGKKEVPFGSVAAEASPGLKDSLAHKEARLRLAALYVLETLGPEAAPAVEDLVKALRDDNAFVRWGAVRALGKMAPVEAKTAVPALAGALGREKNQTIRLTVLAALERYGPRAAGAVEALTQALNSPQEQVRRGSIQALLAVGREARSAVPALIKQLEDPEGSVRATTVVALGKLAPREQAVRDALRLLLEDSDGQVRQCASEALLVESPPEPPPPPEHPRPRGKDEPPESPRRPRE